MATLLQKLGLVTGLGLVGVVGTGCEQTIEVRHSFGGPVLGEKACEGPDSAGPFNFMVVDKHIKKTTLLDVPLRSDVIRTIEWTYLCNPPSLQGRYKNESNGEVRIIQWDDSVNLVTGEVVNHRYRGGSSL